MSRKPLKISEPDLRPEYDFSGAVRGKHYRHCKNEDFEVPLEIEPDLLKSISQSERGETTPVQEIIARLRRIT